MKKLVCLVTGSNTGIGKYTALGLAKQGAQVIMTGRNGDKLTEARDWVMKTTNNSKVNQIVADLSEMQQVVQLSEQLITDYQGLNVVVNNAGIFLTEHRETTDGFETQWAVNYLAPYLLTRKLKSHLTANAPARVVNVSSNAHHKGRIHFKHLDGKPDYQGLRAYSQSKLGNVLFTKELARRWQHLGITANALHPGVIRTSIGNRHGSGWVTWLWNLGKPFMATPEKGASTSVFLSTSEIVEGESGKYFVNSQEVMPSKDSQDPRLAAKLWQVSEDQVSEWL